MARHPIRATGLKASATCTLQSDRTTSGPVRRQRGRAAAEHRDGHHSHHRQSGPDEHKSFTNNRATWVFEGNHKPGHMSWHENPFGRMWKRHRRHPNTPCLLDRKSTRLNSSHQIISYALFCLKKKKLRFV